MLAGFQDVPCGSLQNIRLAVPDTPKCVIWVNETLYVNVGGEYQRMKVPICLIN